MDAAHSIKRHILTGMLDKAGITKEHYTAISTSEGIDRAWKQAEEYAGCFADFEIIDEVNDFRCGGQDTNLPCKEYSRCYECDQVATKLSDGQYVSWVYWSGGGKWGSPDEIEWIDDAFFVNCEEKQVMTTVYNFSIPEERNHATI